MKQSPKYKSNLAEQHQLSVEQLKRLQGIEQLAVAKFMGGLQDELRKAIEAANGIRKKSLSIWLFHTYGGQPYIKKGGSAAGFWQARIIVDT